MGIENRYFPIGLGYLAARLRDQGHEVLIYSVDTSKSVHPPAYNRMHDYYKVYIQWVNDFSHPVWQEIRSFLEQFKPEAIGITAMTPKIASVLRTASWCKRYSPQARVIVGGPHATIRPDELLQWEDVDFVIRGEGEFSLGELIDACQKGNPRLLNALEGLSFRKNGGIFHNPPRSLEEDLDALPFPARELLVYPENFSSEDLAIIMTSRGCPFQCTFCYKEMFGKRVRFRSIDSVLGEIKEVMKRYKATQFAFKDDSFTVNKKRVAELCDRLLEEGIQIHWESTTRVDLIDEPMLQKMAVAGCNMIKVGVESGSESIHQLIKKGISLHQVRQAAQWFNRHGIFWVAFFMMGLPNETEEDIQETRKLMREIQPDYVSIGVYEPYPGTELFDLGTELGLLNPLMSPSQYFERPPDEYYLKAPPRRVNTMEPQKFERICEEMTREFDRYNKGIKRMLKMSLARRKMYSSDLRSFLKDLRRGLKWLRG